MAKHRRQRRPNTKIKVWPLIGRLKRTRVPEKVARPTRTGVFIAAAGWLVDQWSAHVDKLTVDERVTWTGIVAVGINYLVMALEDHFERGVMRQVPPTTVPAVDAAPAPEPDPQAAAVAAIVARNADHGIH